MSLNQCQWRCSSLWHCLLTDWCEKPRTKKITLIIYMSAKKNIQTQNIFSVNPSLFMFVQSVKPLKEIHHGLGRRIFRAPEIAGFPHYVCLHLCFRANMAAPLIQDREAAEYQKPSFCVWIDNTRKSTMFVGRGTESHGHVCLHSPDTSQAAGKHQRYCVGGKFKNVFSYKKVK